MIYPYRYVLRLWQWKNTLRLQGSKLSSRRLGRVVSKQTVTPPAISKVSTMGTKASGERKTLLGILSLSWVVFAIQAQVADFEVKTPSSSVAWHIPGPRLEDSELDYIIQSTVTPSEVCAAFKWKRQWYPTGSWTSSVIISARQLLYYNSQTSATLHELARKCSRTT